MLYILWIMIQICIESMPLSSSGHQYLLEKIVRCEYSPAHLKQMNYALHIFELVILALFFRNRLTIFLRHPIRTRYIMVRLIFKNFIASLLTAVIYFSLLSLVDLTDYLLYGFITTACILVTVDYLPAGKRLRIFWYEYLFLGGLQAIALVPGISRFATVYAGARLLGLNHRSAFEVCFSIQVPLIIGSLMQLLYKGDISTVTSLFSAPLLLVCIGATIISYYLFCLGERWASEHHWKRFAFYMIIPILTAIMVSL